MTTELIQGDCLDELLMVEAGRFDLVFTSPPYEDARGYGMDFSLKGEDWVRWAIPRFVESYRVCKGLTAWVVEGRTGNQQSFRWSATPFLLGAELHRSGVRLRKPPAYHRVGIPGSGGPDWLRNDWEFVLCASHGRLPWSDNTAMGHPPKCPPGGDPSHHSRDGRVKKRKYKPPKIANPGNVIHCHGGRGHMGHDLAHENEAPFPEYLAEFFIRSFCPPGGWVLDPFCGGGTTLAVAERLGRNAVGIDLRANQIDLSRRRLAA